MLGLTAAEIAQALAATLQGSGGRTIQGVCTDSRQVRPGDLFIALPGNRTDGHRFLGEARDAGAAAALVQPDRGVRPAGLDVVVVPDTLAALGELARLWLSRLRAQVVGVTGTVGKTTAKDFLAALLGGPAAGVHAAPASFNSECGLALAVLGAPPGARWLVLEYGVNAPGEMERLLRIARPHHAWTTALTEVHLEGMGDRATLVREKALLSGAVRDGGRVWALPGAHADLAAAGLEPSRVEVAGFCAGGASVLDPTPRAFRVEIPQVGGVALPVVARHEAELAAAAAAIALDLGVPAAALRPRLEKLQRPPGRLTVRAFGAVTVLDDSYNASPAAMEAALEVLGAWMPARRRIAVLGTMHELGAAAERLHRAAGRKAASLCLDGVWTVGAAAAWIADEVRRGAAGTDVREFGGVEEAREAAGAVEAGDVLLLKASRAEGLERLLPALERRACAIGGAAAPGRRLEAVA